MTVHPTTVASIVTTLSWETFLLSSVILNVLSTLYSTPAFALYTESEFTAQPLSVSPKYPLVARILPVRCTFSLWRPYPVSEVPSYVIPSNLPSLALLEFTALHLLQSSTPSNISINGAPESSAVKYIPPFLSTSDAFPTLTKSKLVLPEYSEPSFIVAINSSTSTPPVAAEYTSVTVACISTVGV